MPKKIKHFFDTSTVRLALFGTEFYKQNLQSNLSSNDFHISDYVLMEYRRGMLCTAIRYYEYLNLPTISTVSDANKLWSNRFSSRDVKTVLGLIDEFFSTQQIDSINPAHKKKALLELARFIRSIDIILLSKFTKVGTNSTRCTRSKISLRIDTKTNFGEEMQKFLRAFADEKGCRSKCQIDRFFLEKFKFEVAKYINEAPHFSKTSTKGFHEIVDKLEDLSSKGPEAFTCKTCSKVGDAVIALDAPRDMRLEHVDRSFNALCEIIGQPHKLHPSEIAIHKKKDS